MAPQDVSAAYVLAFVAPMMGIIGAFMFTVLDPIMQNLFSSGLWTSNTSYGTNLLSWMKSTWLYLAVFVLMAILVMVWVRTRRPE